MKGTGAQAARDRLYSLLGSSAAFRGATIRIRQLPPPFGALAPEKGEVAETAVRTQ